MTIRMLQAWNGLHQQKIVTTLSGSDEASLVAAGIATYDLDGPAENLRMAQLATDAGGNVNIAGATAEFTKQALERKTRFKFQKARPLMIADGTKTWASDNSTVTITNAQTFTHPNNSKLTFNSTTAAPTSASARMRCTSLTKFYLEDTVTVAIYCANWPASGTSIEIGFSSDGFVTKSFKYTFSGIAAMNWVRPGIVYFTISTAEDGTATFGGISANAWTSVGGQVATDQMNSVQVAFNSLNTYTLQVLGVWTNKKSTGKILMGFDDGLASQYTEAFSYMQAKGIRGTIALPHELIGTAGYCTQAQLDEIYAAGWDFVGHSSSHPVLTLINIEAALNEVRKNKYYCDGRYPRGADCMVYPENTYNANVTAECRKAGWRYMRAASRRFMSVDAFGIDNADAIGSQTLSTMTLQQIKDIILSAANSGQVLWLYGHNILIANNPAGLGGAAPTSPTTDYYRDDFRAIIDYIATLKSQGLVEDVTWSELQAHLDGPMQVYQ